MPPEAAARGRKRREQLAWTAQRRARAVSKTAASACRSRHPLSRDVILRRIAEAPANVEPGDGRVGRRAPAGAGRRCVAVAALKVACGKAGWWRHRRPEMGAPARARSRSRRCATSAANPLSFKQDKGLAELDARTRVRWPTAAMRATSASCLPQRCSALDELRSSGQLAPADRYGSFRRSKPQVAFFLSKY